MIATVPMAATCSNCGAPIAFTGSTATCEFCDTVNQAPPKEVKVAVPVQVIHQTVHVQQGEPGAAVLQCPHCGRRLATVRVKDVELNGCGACGGIWVDNTSAQNLVKAPDTVFEDLATRCAAGARSRTKHAKTPVCAQCRIPLDPVTNGQLELDVCTTHGTWFDAFELAALIRALMRPEAPVSAGVAAPVPCVGCQKKMPAANANITGRGPMCDECWREEQDRQLATASDTSGFSGTLLDHGPVHGHQHADVHRGGANRNMSGIGIGLGVVGALFDVANHRHRR